MSMELRVSIIPSRLKMAANVARETVTITTAKLPIPPKLAGKAQRLCHEVGVWQEKQGKASRFV